MNNFKSEVQVRKEHYGLVQGSFINAYNQASDIFGLIKRHNIIRPKILIIGIGDNLLSIILKNKFNCVVKTMDIDPELESDIVCSIENLQGAVSEKFDIIVCTHVLEHLPFEYFNDSLRQIGLVSEYSLVYLPIAKFGLSFGFGIYPLFFKKITLALTWFFKKHNFDGQHYWEIGVRGYPLSKIKKDINKYFNIEIEYNPVNWLYSYNFILRSKKNSYE